MDPDITTQNNAERDNLASLIARLTDADFGRDLGDGWTVATALAHLAFWDRYDWSRLEAWRPGEALSGEPQPDWLAEVLNRGLQAEWNALPPHEAARLALEAADAVNTKVASIDAGLADEIIPLNEHWLRHRREHLDQIERALGGS